MYSQSVPKLGSATHEEGPPMATATRDDGKAGLEDVVAARSAICAVDGAAGRPYYRGYEIGDLAGRVSVEEVTQLLWEGGLPEPAPGRAFAPLLPAAPGLPPHVAALLPTLPPAAPPRA